MAAIILPILKLNIRVTYLQTISHSTQFFPKERTLGKIVNAAIVGAPNSGKSTLINKILERKVCPTSNKVHTTTRLARAMCFENDTQIIFLDTPGVITDKEQNKYKLPESMKQACKKSLSCADVIGVVHDVSNRWTKDKLHPTVTELLNMVKKVPSFLIINKVWNLNYKIRGIFVPWRPPCIDILVNREADKITKYVICDGVPFHCAPLYSEVDKLKSKKQLLDIIRNLTNGCIAGNPIPNAFKNKNIKADNGYSHFSDVFLVSALNGDGVKDIKEYLMTNSKVRAFQYSSEDWTDSSPETLIEDAARAKFLDFLSQELPYKLDIKLEYYDVNEEENKILCSIMVQCPTERLVKLISGAGGGRLQQIKSSLRSDLVDMLQKPVTLDINLISKNKS